VNIERRLVEIVTKLESMERTLDALDVTVRGNADYGAPGLAPRVVLLETRVNKIESALNRAVWIAAGMGAAGFGVGKLIEALIG